MTIYGASAGMPGYNGQASVQAIDQWFGGIKIFRAFDPDFPSKWNGTGKAKYTPSGCICWHSFKSPSIPAAAQGQQNSAFYNFLMSIPENQDVWITMNHEPEDNQESGQFTIPQWQSAQNHLFDQVDQVIQDTGRTNMLKTTVLMSFTIAGNGRNVEDWYNNRVDIMGFDNYRRALLDQIADYVDTKPKPWAIAEWANRDPSPQQDSAYAAYINESANRWENVYPKAPIAVCYWEAADGWDYVITPQNQPLSIAAWRNLVTGGTATIPDGEDTGGTGGEDSSGPPPGGLISNIVYIDLGSVGQGSNYDIDYDGPASRPGSGWEVHIYDLFNPGTRLAQIPRFKEFSFTRPLNDVGSGSVTFSMSDPIRDILLPTEDQEEGRYLFTFPLYISFVYDGSERFRMIYEGKEKEPLKPEEPEVMTLTGSGRAAEMAWGIVLPANYPSNTKAWARKRQDTTWAQLFVTLWNEAKDRGEIQNLELAFSRDADSYGVPWSTLGDREVEIGTSLLDLLQTYADAEEFEWLVSPNGRLFAAPVLGQDLSMDVRFFGAVNIQEAGKLEERRDIRNRIYVEGNTGRISMAESGASQERWGLRAMYLRSEEAKTERQRMRVALGTLRQTKRPQRENSIKVPMDQRDPVTDESYGRALFTDYHLADTIGFGPRIEPRFGEPKPSRDVKVQEIGINVKDGHTDVELLFETRAERMAERAKRLLQQRFGAWSSAKTARMGKSPVSNLRDTDAEFPIPGETSSGTT